MNEVRLSSAEIHHLVALLRDDLNAGSYWGNKKQYEERSRRLIIKLNASERPTKCKPK